MRIIQLWHIPVWIEQTEVITQDRIINRLFLGNESVRDIYFWCPHVGGLVYIDVRMSQDGPIGMWHTYWVTSRFEWIRSLHVVRDLYQGAAEAHDNMITALENQMQLWEEKQNHEILSHDWKKDGF